MNSEELRELKEHFEWLIEEQKRQIDNLQQEVDNLTYKLDLIQRPFGDPLQ